MRHGLSKDLSGNTYQWHDAERYIIMDIVTGELQRFGRHHNSIGTYEEAKEYLFPETLNEGMPSRNAMIKMDCIVCHQLGREKY
tara:strand:+ start:1133 stop:1384 length:252 start_codon:yes stop_codon:yes gene_type:complete